LFLTLKPVDKSRRKFLKSVGVGAGAWMVSGCSTIDNFYLGQTRDFTDRVVILGAGISGLVAALELKKANIPYILIEGSNRVGGRMFSLDDFADTGRAVDLGGEWIYPSQSAIISLAKDLRVGLDEYSFSGLLTVHKNGQWVETASHHLELQTALAKINSEIYNRTNEVLTPANQFNFPKAVIFNNLSIEDMISRLSVRISSGAVNYARSFTVQQWGVSPKEINALMLLHKFKEMGRARSAFRIEGGAQNLATAIFDRISGVIPEKTIKLGHELVKIKPRSDFYELYFQNADQIVSFKARQIVCALPLKIAAEIEGIDELNLPAGFLTFVKSAASSDLSRITAFSTDKLPPSKFFKNQNWLFENQGFYMNEGPFELRNELANSKGILQATYFGKSATDLPASAGELLKKQLAEVFGKTPNFKEIHLHNWVKHKWAKSGKTYLKPKQALLVPANEQIHDHWKFCGEYAVTDGIGTMNAAVVSAMHAAQFWKSKKTS
jgi:monoamine oxidase